MTASIGGTLAELRKDKGLMQKDIAAMLTERGFKVNAKSIYNWEKGIAQPSIQQFLALCGIFGIDDVQWQFGGVHMGPLAGLNKEGRQKAREFISLLFRIDSFRDDPVPISGAPRMYRLYDIPVSAGTGNFLDDSGYEMIEAPAFVPPNADFALRITGNSMEPLFQDGRVVWVKTQESLKNGDIGIFIYDDEVYCKKLIYADGGTVLRSLNKEYDDITINDGFGFKAIGKVVA